MLNTSPRSLVCCIYLYWQVCQKRPFALLMRAAHRRNPEDYHEFWPETWVFPDDPPPPASSVRAGGPLIWKPSDG
eukprot:COSAG05_NODE_19660_length_289_cov_1.068421_1_plen_74_part_01